MAGILKFDPRDRVNAVELERLAVGIDAIGPDGGDQYNSGAVGMVYRAFKTPPESHFEHQPHVFENVVLTWDGRLDNREEIRSLVGNHLADSPTDLALVFAAYMA